MAHPTLNDVARIARVSGATVSRALRLDPRVTPQTTERVRAAADQIGYRPNANARQLSSQRLETVGVILDAFSNVFAHFASHRVMTGMLAELEADRHNLQVVTTHTPQGDRAIPEDQIPRILSEHALAGVVMVGGIPRQLRGILDQARMPWIAADTHIEDPHDCVRVYEDNILSLAVHHLYDLGHRRIAYVTNAHERHPCIPRRQNAYLKAMAELGLSVYPGYDRIGPFDERVDELVRFSRPPTGLVCFDDHVTMLVIRRLKALGVRVPEDLSVVGINDENFAPLACPALTTVAIPFNELGEAAGRMICRKLQENTSVPSEFIGGRLVVRETTAPPRSA